MLQSISNAPADPSASGVVSKRKKRTAAKKTPRKGPAAASSEQGSDADSAASGDDDAEDEDEEGDVDDDNPTGGRQFICTTFRPEMLLVAEKCYGVRYVGKSSSVVAVSREDAMEFVQGEKQ